MPAGGIPTFGIPGGLPYWGRLSTSQRRMDPTWDFVDPPGDEALPFADAYTKIAMGDPRPVLLLRDCGHSEKDLAKISTFTEDERVVLGMNWFHLVRIHKDSVKPNHPLHSLVGAQNSHMVIFTNDGEKRIDMALVPTANGLWGQMVKGLKLDYKRSPEDAVSEWRKVLTEFDRIDKESARLKGEDYRRNGEDEGIQKKLEELEARRQKATAEEKRVKELGFRDPNKKTPESDESWRDGLLKKKTPAKPAGN